MCVHTQSLQSCPTLCDLRTVALQAPLSMGLSSKNTRVRQCPLSSNSFIIGSTIPLSAFNRYFLLVLFFFYLFFIYFYFYFFFLLACSLKSLPKYMLSLASRCLLLLLLYALPHPQHSLSYQVLCLAHPSTFVIVVAQSLRLVQIFATAWTAACQSPLSFTVSWLHSNLVHWICDVV